jgi:hypothetical protein
MLVPATPKIRITGEPTQFHPAFQVERLTWRKIDRVLSAGVATQRGTQNMFPRRYLQPDGFTVTDASNLYPIQRNPCPSSDADEIRSASDLNLRADGVSEGKQPNFVRRKSVL